MKKLIISIFVFFGCSSTLPDDNLSLAEHLKIGMDHLDNEEFVKAQDAFKYVLSRGAGTDYGDDAQFFLGESYFLDNQYLLAITEYENLTRKMAYSPFFEKSRFRICESYSYESPDYFNDQTFTEKALERYQDFLDDFPNSEYVFSINKSMTDLRYKLAKKLFETGILYMKMDEYEPARMSFNQILDKYYDTDIIVDVHIKIIDSYIKDNKTGDALAHWKEHSYKYIDNMMINNQIDKLFTEYDIAID